jgi:hypothetical protein
MRLPLVATRAVSSGTRPAVMRRGSRYPGGMFAETIEASRVSIPALYQSTSEVNPSGKWGQ